MFFPRECFFCIKLRFFQCWYNLARKIALLKKIWVRGKRALWYEKWVGGVKKAICQNWGSWDPKKRKYLGCVQGRTTSSMIAIVRVPFKPTFICIYNITTTICFSKLWLYNKVVVTVVISVIQLVSDTIVDYRRSRFFYFNLFVTDSQYNLRQL